MHTEEPTPLVKYGSMHEALAKGESEARVLLADLSGREHFYAVGALEGLEGEITMLDSAVFATTFAPEGGLEPLDPSKHAATLLVGQSVPHWSGLTLDADVPPEQFDEKVRKTAAGQGVDVSEPFMFVIVGAFNDVRLHVIHGACPVHARMMKLELTEEKRPYESEVARVQGTVVGIYAADAVGKLTHPATSTHPHLVFVDAETGKTVTGHLERVGIAAGSILKVPNAGASRTSSERSGD